MSLDFWSFMYVKVCIGGLLLQRDITKDDLGGRDGEVEGHKMSGCCLLSLVLAFCSSVELCM